MLTGRVGQATAIDPPSAFFDALRQDCFMSSMGEAWSCILLPATCRPAALPPCPAALLFLFRLWFWLWRDPLPLFFQNDLIRALGASPVDSLEVMLAGMPVQLCQGLRARLDESRMTSWWPDRMGLCDSCRSIPASLCTIQDFYKVLFPGRRPSRRPLPVACQCQCHCHYHSLSPLPLPLPDPSAVRGPPTLTTCHDQRQYQPCYRYYAY